MNNLDILASEWLKEKAKESAAIIERRKLEDAITKLVDLSDSLEGVETADTPRYKIKITGRIDRKVDSDLLQEIAAEHGLSSFLSDLFRWKPEVNKIVWSQTDKAITSILSAAITAKPGRPSFAISTITKE